jgi:hypothetical protein
MTEFAFYSPLPFDAVERFAIGVCPNLPLMIRIDGAGGAASHGSQNWGVGVLCPGFQPYRLRLWISFERSERRQTRKFIYYVIYAGKIGCK